MKFKLGIGFALSALLAACGGGSDAPAGYNVDAAFTTLFTQGATFQVQGILEQSSPPLSISETHTYQPLGQQAFGGGTAQAVRHTRTSTASPVTQAETLYFGSAPLSLRGVQTFSGNLEAYDSLGTLPANAQVGASGQFAKTRSDVATATVVAWDLSAGDTAGTAWACLRSVVASAGGSSVGTCLKIDMAEHILAARYDYRSLAFSAVLQ